MYESNNVESRCFIRFGMVEINRGSSGRPLLSQFLIYSTTSAILGTRKRGLSFCGSSTGSTGDSVGSRRVKSQEISPVQLNMVVG